MADTATDVRVVAAAEPGSLAAESKAAVRRVIIGKYFGWTSHELTEKLAIAYDMVRVGPARRARKTLKAVS